MNLGKSHTPAMDAIFPVLPDVDGHQDLPSDGYETSAMAITGRYRFR